LEQFRIFLCASTTLNANGSASVYTPLAEADWYINASGWFGGGVWTSMPMATIAGDRVLRSLGSGVTPVLSGTNFRDVANSGYSTGP
jgi:hypothetical protein